MTMYSNMPCYSRVQQQTRRYIKSDSWHVWGIVWGIKTLTCQIQADGHLPTLKTAFPVKQANICILLLQHSKYYKQQPVKNDLNCSKEPLDSFLAFGLLK